MATGTAFEHRWNRRALIAGLGCAWALGSSGSAAAQSSTIPFDQWLRAFKARALAAGVSEATYDRVTSGLQPDMEVFELERRQPEFTQTIWQYLNARVSDWRITAGRQRVAENAELLTRVAKTYGVDPYVVASIWGNESAYGEVLTNPRAMRPVLPALAALAWGEARRRSYWETEFLDALLIVERRWSEPAKMNGSWAGAMGHTQFMPSTWLRLGVAFSGDGHADLYRAADALASTARFLRERGHWVEGVPWGYEVKAEAGFDEALADNRRLRTVKEWDRLGIKRADGAPHPNGEWEARLAFPMGLAGPGFLLFSNFRAIMAYNPSFNYALAVGLLSDRLRGGGPLIRGWPGAERPLTLAEVQEIQQRLTTLGFDTGGTDGRVGDITRRAIKAFQDREHLTPADGQPGEAVLKRLRELDTNPFRSLFQ